MFNWAMWRGRVGVCGGECRGVGVSADILREPGGRAEIQTVLRDAVQVKVERFCAQRGSAEPCFTDSVDRK